jgi:hypothetical protein
MPSAFRQVSWLHVGRAPPRSAHIRNVAGPRPHLHSASVTTRSTLAPPTCLIRAARAAHAALSDGDEDAVPVCDDAPILTADLDRCHRICCQIDLLTAPSEFVVQALFPCPRTGIGRLPIGTSKISLNGGLAAMTARRFLVLFATTSADAAAANPGPRGHAGVLILPLAAPVSGLKVSIFEGS